MSDIEPRNYLENDNQLEEADESIKKNEDLNIPEFDKGTVEQIVNRAILLVGFDKIAYWPDDCGGDKSHIMLFSIILECLPNNLKGKIDQILENTKSIKRDVVLEQKNPLHIPDNIQQSIIELKPLSGLKILEIGGNFAYLLQQLGAEVEFYYGEEKQGERSAIDLEKILNDNIHMPRAKYQQPTNYRLKITLENFNRIFKNRKFNITISHALLDSKWNTNFQKELTNVFASITEKNGLSVPDDTLLDNRPCFSLYANGVK